MPLTPQQIEEMDKLTGLSAPATTSKTGAARFAELEKLTPTKPTLASKLSERVGNVKTAISQSVEAGKDNSPQNYSSGATKMINAGASIPGQALGAVGDVIGTGIEATGLDKPIAQIAKPIIESEPIKKVTEFYQSLPKETQDLLANVTNIASIIPGVKGGQIVKDVAKTGIVTTGEVAKNGLEAAANLGGGLGKKAIDFISADPEKKVATILKESKPEDVTKYASIAEKAASDPRVATPFEVVGNKLGDATKIIRDKAKEIAQQKKQIIEKNDVGGKQFISEIDNAVSKFQKLANKYPEAQKFVDALKGKVTKLDADTAIDDLQDILYTGSQNMTIPTGSRLAQQAKGILGEFNGKLKASLPKEYTALNDEYGKIAQHLGTINRSLGEVVDGVPLRGASLIKQFFSPSGTKSKEIFDFVKQQTNGEIDLAKDATLAKFTMELFDDPRARSLLQGISDIPTTVTGAVGKVVEKLGGEKLQGAMRESTLKKAKEISSPK